ncbi:unnamed protein product [Heterosigma akashiwo]
MADVVQPSERLACSHSTTDRWPFQAALSIALLVRPSERLACRHSTKDRWPCSAAFSRLCFLCAISCPSRRPLRSTILQHAARSKQVHCISNQQQGLIVQSARPVYNLL